MSKRVSKSMKLNFKWDLRIILYPEYDSDPSQNVITSSFGQAYQHKNQKDEFIRFGVVTNTDKQTDRRTQRHNLFAGCNNWIQKLVQKLIFKRDDIDRSDYKILIDLISILNAEVTIYFGIPN